MQNTLHKRIERLERRALTPSALEICNAVDAILAGVDITADTPATRTAHAIVNCFREMDRLTTGEAAII